MTRSMSPSLLEIENGFPTAGPSTAAANKRKRADDT